MNRHRFILFLLLGAFLGASTTRAATSDYRVVAWGYNRYGETNVPVAAQSGVTWIAAGFQRTVVLKKDGSVFVWGWNFAGQTNVPVEAQSGVTAIAAGFDHTAVIQTCPLILSQPSDALVFIGSDATFSVSATTDDPPLSYQWRFNEKEIAGATADTLTVTNAQIVNSGKYNVLVSDKVGSSSSTITWIWAVAWCWRRTASVGWREGLSRAAICPLRGERRPG